MTIGAKMRESVAPDAKRGAINKALGHAGLRLIHHVLWDGRVSLKLLLVADHHPGLERIFYGTCWAGAGWIDALRELDGTEPWPSGTHFGNSSSRA